MATTKQTPVLKLKSIGARVNEEIFENIKYEAIKRNITQGAFIEEVYSLFPNKIKSVEIKALKELAKQKELARIAEEEAKAERLKAIMADDDKKSAIEKSRRDVNKNKAKLNELKLERQKLKAQKKYDLPQDDVNGDNNAQEEVA